MGIFDKPKLRRGNKKKDTVPDDLWTKCPDCGELIHTLDLRQDHHVCPHCNHHFLMEVRDRIALLGHLHLTLKGYLLCGQACEGLQA